MWVLGRLRLDWGLPNAKRRLRSILSGCHTAATIALRQFEICDIRMHHLVVPELRLKNENAVSSGWQRSLAGMYQRRWYVPGAALAGQTRPHPTHGIHP